MSGMLVLFHCESNPGFAASSHEHTFLRVAESLTTDISEVHFAYSRLDGGMTPTLPKELKNVIQLNTVWTEPHKINEIENYVRKHRITRLLGFDQPVYQPMYQALRAGGIKTFVSYWGAPMSSRNSGVKLLLKKLEVALRKTGPDHFIFQSEGMRETAVGGRGIPKARTSVVKTGVNTDRFLPDVNKKFYAHDCFGIPRDRQIVVYSGHMEKRKGVHVILKAAKSLVRRIGRQDVHFLILGNRPGEIDRFTEYLQDKTINDHITFGGYRADLPDLLKSCSIGMIASTDWDSFPMSSLEMAATELPLLVSDLPGLNEAVTPLTGMTFPINDHETAANALDSLLGSPEKLLEYGRQARQRVIQEYSQKSQAQGILDVFQGLEQSMEQAS